MDQKINPNSRRIVVPVPNISDPIAAPPGERLPPNQRVNASVQRAWERVLEPGSFEAGFGFDAAGGDSLRLLKFAFFLEQELRTELPLDLFSSTMTPHDIAWAIDRHLAGAEGPGYAATRLVHVLPGRSRDEQRLVRFRKAFTAGFDMRAVDYGDWHQWTGRGFGVDNLIEQVVTDIMDSQPSGPVLLLGYSVGGYAAFAVARRMLALGRQVGLLGILDTNLAFNERGGFRVGRHDGAAERARILHGIRQGKASEPLAEFAVRRLTGPRWAPLLRTLARFPHACLPGELGFYLHEHLRARMLTDLIARLRPATQEADVLPGVPVVVFRAREQERAAAPDLGWGLACPGLNVIPVDGGHHTMFDPPHLDGLVSSVQKILDDIAAGT